MENKIKDIKAWQILDSKGNPALRVEIETYEGIKGFASVPSGTSKGRFEAFELRDNDKSVYGGLGVLKAVNNVKETIKNALKDKCVLNGYEIDNLLVELDNTENKSKLGANAILGVSMAAACCASNCLNIPLYEYIGGINAVILPVPMINIINGGAHANNNLDFQEFMITPVGAESFYDAIRMSSEIFHTLEKNLKKENMSTSVGLEGGFTPDLKTNKDAIELILNAINDSGYTTDEVKICLDIASSELYKDGKYNFRGENLILDKKEAAEYFEHLVEDYPVISIEDGMAQDDYDGWRILTDKLKDKCLLVGDDLFVTNSKLLKEGIENNIANAILIKPNQIGTVSETIETVRIAKNAGYKNIISHRSAETEDTFIADFAVGINSGLIKTGSMSRSERTAKYNRLLIIEDELKKSGKYTGLNSYFKNAKICCSKCNRHG